jgi:hypothetical protein
MQNNLEDQEHDEPHLPRGVISHRKRWQGEELEIKHQQETSQSETHKDSAAAVDITQFQNHVVGQGYQAKHVIRQPTAGTPKTEIRDMTGGFPSGKASNVSGLAKKVAAEKTNYIENAGLREFRREIENILSS